MKSYCFRVVFEAHSPSFTFFTEPFHRYQVLIRDRMSVKHCRCSLLKPSGYPCDWRKWNPLGAGIDQS